MIKYMVIGDPVGHSRSPEMQNAAFEYYGMGRIYDKLQVTPDELPEFVKYARKNLLGVNLTIPHKVAIIPLIDEIDPVAKIGGSVNTIKIENNKIHGYSTDGVGLEQAIVKNFHISLGNGSFTFLGSGGAVRAAAAHFASKGAKTVNFINRTESHAQALAEQLKKHFPYTDFNCTGSTNYEKIREFLGHSQILIQGTSLGLKPNDPPPLDLTMVAGKRQFGIFDMIYQTTPLVETGNKLGLKSVNGSDMLIFQGAASFEIWTELPPPIEEMERGFAKGNIK